MDKNTFRFAGRTFTYDTPKASPTGDEPIGPYIERASKAALANAAADQRAFQAAQAANAKQQKARDRALAEQLARDFEIM
jgi:hypothetical protein